MHATSFWLLTPLPAFWPKAMLLPPVVLLTSAEEPSAVLLLPVVLFPSAETPFAVLNWPVLLLKRMIAGGGVITALRTLRQRTLQLQCC